MAAYQPIDTIPLGVWVEVVSVTDKVRRARVFTFKGGARWVKRQDSKYPARVLCKSDIGGDIWAKAWRHYPHNEVRNQ